MYALVSLLGLKFLRPLVRHSNKIIKCRPKDTAKQISRYPFSGCMFVTFETESEFSLVQVTAIQYTQGRGWYKPAAAPH